MDHVTTETRSKIMSAVHPKNTKPEIRVRKLIHAMGYRYRLHDKKLPGKPDLVFKSKKKVIFVNGCFWHGHKRCEKAKLPKTHTDYWQNKIELNKIRDRRNEKKLKEMGWTYLKIWQCDLKRMELISKCVCDFLDAKHNIKIIEER